ANGWISSEVARATKALPAHSRLDNNRPAAAQAEREFITYSQRLSTTRAADRMWSLRPERRAPPYEGGQSLTRAKSHSTASTFPSSPDTAAPSPPNPVEVRLKPSDAAA